MGTSIALHETTPRPIGRRLETAGEIEMAMRMKQMLYSAVASCALAGALYVPARAAGLNIETATIADLNAAFAGGTLTSEHAWMPQDMSHLRTRSETTLGCAAADRAVADSPDDT